MIKHIYSIVLHSADKKTLDSVVVAAFWILADLSNDAVYHLTALGMGSVSRRRFTAENRFVPDCSGVVTARAFVTVNLLIECSEMSVYYCYYIITRTTLVCYDVACVDSLSLSLSLSPF